MNEILSPARLWSRAEVLASPSPVPRLAGVYGWFFKPIPRVPSDGCVMVGDFALLYVGIAPKSPPLGGGRSSSQTLRHRIRYHYRGNAEGSTLRLTLGCLLSTDLGIELRRVGSGNRLTFHEGEERLSRWMSENAFVTWAVCPRPWETEKQLINSVSLPLNLDQNRTHIHHAGLSALRRAAKKRARDLPIVSKA